MILTFLQLFFYFDLWFDFSFRFFSFLIGCNFLFWFWLIVRLFFFIFELSYWLRLLFFSFWFYGLTFLFNFRALLLVATFFFYFDYRCGGLREKQIHGQRFPQIQSNNISLSRESIKNLDLIIFCLRQISQIWVFNNLWIFNQVEPPPGVNIWSVNRWSTFRGKPISRLFGRDRRWIYYKSLPFLRIFPP